MSDLRKKLIRLAHQKPHLRSDLLPLIQKQASLPTATNRPATKKFRQKVAEWMTSDIQNKLENAGVPQRKIDITIKSVASSRGANSDSPLWRKDGRSWSYFQTQREIIDWLKGKYILDLDWPPSFRSYPEILKYEIERYGGSTNEVRDIARAKFNALKPHQKAFAAFVLGATNRVSLYKSVKQLKEEIETYEIGTVERMIPALKWAATVSKPPNENFLRNLPSG